MKKHVKEEPEGHLKMINETLKKMKDQVEKNTVTLDTQVKQLAVIEVPQHLFISVNRPSLVSLPELLKN